MKTTRNFSSESFYCLVVKFSIYLNRRVLRNGMRRLLDAHGLKVRFLMLRLKYVAYCPYK